MKKKILKREGGRKTVLVIFGGNSTEHDISIITGVHALNAMPIRGYKIYPIYIQEGRWYTGSYLYDIKNFVNFDTTRVNRVALIGGELFGFSKKKVVKISGVDCALLATHGGEGENGCLQGFLDINKLPYTSSGAKESALCMDKLMAKAVLKSYGIKVVNGVEVLGSDTKEIEKVENLVDYPMIIKPACQGSSIGISIAENKAELIKGIELAKFFDNKVLVEKALTEFEELNCAAVTLNGELLVSEIEKPLTVGNFLSYDDKYMKGYGKGMGGSKREFPAKIEDSIREQIRDITKKAYKALNLFGVVRIDYLVENGEVYLNEINTIPGSLSHYLFPQLSHTDFLKGLVESAISRGVTTFPAYQSKVLTNIGLKHK